MRQATKSAARGPHTDHDSVAKATVAAGFFALIGWAVIVLALSLTSVASLVPRPVGNAIEHLGQFGDAFAPVTAFFALMAAVGAWRSYGAQREQLDDERERSHTQRFDELFFRLVDYYERTLNTPAGLKLQVRRGHGDSSGFGGFENVPAPAREFIDSMNRAFLMAAEKQSEAAEQQGEFQRWSSALYGPNATFKECAPLAAQIPAMLRWLEKSRVRDVAPYGDLLCARLSDAELWFWQRAIAAGAVHLVDFAQEMRIFGEGSDPPKFIGTGRGMTADEARAFAVHADSTTP